MKAKIINDFIPYYGFYIGHNLKGEIVEIEGNSRSETIYQVRYNYEYLFVPKEAVEIISETKMKKSDFWKRMSETIRNDGWNHCTVCPVISCSCIGTINNSICAEALQKFYETKTE